MPCNSEHMEPSYDEVESRKVCQHIVYLYEKLGLPVVPWIKKAAEDYYGDPRRLGEAEKILINKLSDLNETEFDAVVYNARSKKARALADWYEDITERIQDELERVKLEAERKKRAESLLTKMRAEEVEILRDYLKEN